MPLQKSEVFTVKDIYALPEGQRAELINGVLYNMAPPSRIHQEIVSGLHYKIRDYIEKERGSCRVYPAPFAVFLSQDSKNYVEPDISVVCRLDKLDDKGCNGAPDWVIEVVSPSTQHMDYYVKLFKYRTAGVREYWIVNPARQTVQTYTFEGEEGSMQLSFDDAVQVGIFSGLTIRINDLATQILYAERIYL